MLLVLQCTTGSALLTKMRNLVCEEGQFGFLFFLPASFLFIKTLWEYWEGFNVLKEIYAVSNLYRLAHCGHDCLITFFFFWLHVLNHANESHYHLKKAFSQARLVRELFQVYWACLQRHPLAVDNPPSSLK